jgi:hypothetical protein
LQEQVVEAELKQVQDQDNLKGEVVVEEMVLLVNQLMVNLQVVQRLQDQQILEAVVEVICKIHQLIILDQLAQVVAEL